MARFDVVFCCIAIVHHDGVSTPAGMRWAPILSPPRAAAAFSASRGRCAQSGDGVDLGAAEQPTGHGPAFATFQRPGGVEEWFKSCTWRWLVRNVFEDGWSCGTMRSIESAPAARLKLRLSYIAVKGGAKHCHRSRVGEVVVGGRDWAWGGGSRKRREGVAGPEFPAEDGVVISARWPFSARG